LTANRVGIGTTGPASGHTRGVTPVAGTTDGKNGSAWSNPAYVGRAAAVVMLAITICGHLLRVHACATCALFFVFAKLTA
jgi:hypothetical protein